MRAIFALLIFIALVEAALAERLAIIAPDGTIERICPDCSRTDGRKPGYKLLPVQGPGAQPVYDPETQVLPPMTTTIGKDAVVQAWPAPRAKTAQELSADKDARADFGRDLKAILCAIVNEQRAAAVPPGTPISTPAQCQAYLRSKLP